MNNRKWTRAILLGLFAALMFLSVSCGKKADESGGKKVLVLGLDGLDPRLLRAFVAEGEMPNFSKLMGLNREVLEFGTSLPPQSPVAWSNFITGADPGAHGIFDFIHRKPKDYMPYLSTSETVEAKRVLRVGGWEIPLSKSEVRNLRGGRAFWEILDERGIPATVYRIPSNFPPRPTGARTLAGMGTPDLLGGYGTFTFFTDDRRVNPKGLTGGRIVHVKKENGVVVARLCGPASTYRKGKSESCVLFKVHIDEKTGAAGFDVQGQKILLLPGEWSGWTRIRFDSLPVFGATTGIARFYLKETKPHFKLYVSPLNIDPSNPAMPISTPPGFSRELYRRFGFFSTLGIVEDTKALNHGILTEDEFLAQTRLVYDEAERMFDYELKNLKGFLFFYVSEADLGQHMFWSGMDASHEMHESRGGGSRGRIYEIYKRMDRLVGKAIYGIDNDTTLIVMSDHGFASYERSFNLNTWLIENGYMRLVDPADRESEYLTNVDWSRTSAYALGFNALYVNTAGREGQGIVAPGAEKKALMREIRRKLLEAVDPKTGRKPIIEVYATENEYRGARKKDAPDFIVGYRRGYRASWETALGAAPRELFTDNEEKWSGDHCMAPGEVPGIILSNKIIRRRNPDLRDIAATALDEFGAPIPRGIDGKSLFR